MRTLVIVGVVLLVLVVAFLVAFGFIGARPIEGGMVDENGDRPA